MTVSAAGALPSVMDAIQRASARSGVGFDYLLATARKESGLDCQAKSKTSSACGLYQFVAQTWLSTLKAHGAEHGLGDYAADIGRNAQGQFTVADPARRAEILALREDPAIAASLAADLAGDNADVLSQKLGRAPEDGELYAAHVLGAAGAAKLLGLAGTNPDGAAADYFADAASRNRGLFYDRTGAPVSVLALARRLTGGAVASAPAATAAAAAPVSAPAPASVPALRQSIGFAGELDVPFAATPAPVIQASAAPLPSVWQGDWRVGTSRAPLALTPQVLSILSSLYPPDMATADDKPATRRSRI